MRASAAALIAATLLLAAPAPARPGDSAGAEAPASLSSAPAAGSPSPDPAAPAEPLQASSAPSSPPPRDVTARSPTPGRESYVALKLGRFSPRANDVEDLGGGFAGEIAFGRSFHRHMAAEFGIGYSRISDGAAAGPVRALTIVPVALSFKAVLPVGPVDIYLLAGVGGQYGRAEDGSGRKDYDWTVGYRAGIGGNVNLGRAFVGVEAVYLNAEQEFAFAQALDTDGLQATGHVGFRY